MATRKTSIKIDPVQIAALALKRIKTKEDYSRIVAANAAADINSAWAMLSSEEQQHINNICGQAPQSDFAIAQELMSCETLPQLQAIKATYGELRIKQAWQLLSTEARNRIKALCDNCDNGQKEEPQQLMTEEPAVYEVETQPAPRRSLFNISDDLEQLNNLLDEVGDDAQQQELISQWFETLGEERDKKLDGYAALISEMQARADVRKAEARRMQELAATDENRARLLKERLKSFFQLHDLKTIETPRYKLSLAKNGGKAPLVMDENVPVNTLPEHFQRVSIDVDKEAIRTALEAGEHLTFARLGERGQSLRIK